MTSEPKRAEMWVVTTAALVVVLAVVIVANLRRWSKLEARVAKLLRTFGDEGFPPSTPESGLDRLDQLFVDTDIDSELSARRTVAALEQISTGAVVADADGHMVLRNRAAEPFAGGRHGNALVEAAIQRHLSDALRGQHTDEELWLHGPPERVLFIVGSPLIVEGELIGAIVLIDDVSEQHRIDSVRRDFVSNVSHELRTPVGALSLLAETLENENDPVVIRRFLGRIQTEASRLSQLIDDLLDLSRIEDGIGDRAEKISLLPVLSEAAAATRAAAEHRGVLVEVDGNVDESSTVVSGDRSQLLSAITNLFENAVKYTGPDGTVVGRLAKHGNEVAVAVIDTGIGIPQKDVHRVFERFYRVDRGRSSESGGTGLGLSIVRNVAVNHGGRVEVTSQEGVGSTFTLILPAVTIESSHGAPV